MRIAVLGARGKVGRALCGLIEAADDLSLVERIGAQEGDGVAPLSAASLDADMVIDFSTPVASLELLSRLAGKSLPVVVGTTGFSAGQHALLEREGQRRAIMAGANFTPGFEAFRAAGLALAAQLSGAALTLSETYHALKKPVASGTTEGLLADLRARIPDMRCAVDIRREGEVAGRNAFGFDLGESRIELQLSVRSRAAYAQGALDAARWLARKPAGFYRPADMLK